MDLEVSYLIKPTHDPLNETLELYKIHPPNDFEIFSIFNSNSPGMFYYASLNQIFINTFGDIHKNPTDKSFFYSLQREITKLVQNTKPLGSLGITFEKQMPFFDLDFVTDIFYFIYQKFKAKDNSIGSQSP